MCTYHPSRLFRSVTLSKAKDKYWLCHKIHVLHCMLTKKRKYLAIQIYSCSLVSAVYQQFFPAKGVQTRKYNVWADHTVWPPLKLTGQCYGRQSNQGYKNKQVIFGRCPHISVGINRKGWMLLGAKKCSSCLNCALSY